MSNTKPKRPKRKRIKREKSPDEYTTPGEAYGNASLVMGTSHNPKR